MDGDESTRQGLGWTWKAHFMELTELYVFADRCDVRLLRNSIVDAMHASFLQKMPGQDRVYAVTHVPDNSGLYKWLVDYSMLKSIGWKAAPGSTMPSFPNSFYLRVGLRAADLLAQKSTTAKDRGVTDCFYTSLTKLVDTAAIESLSSDLFWSLSRLPIHLLIDSFSTRDENLDFFAVPNLCRYHEHEKKEEASACAEKYKKRYHGRPVWRLSWVGGRPELNAK